MGILLTLYNNLNESLIVNQYWLSPGTVVNQLCTVLSPYNEFSRSYEKIYYVENSS